MTLQDGPGQKEGPVWRGLTGFLQPEAARHLTQELGAAGPGHAVMGAGHCTGVPAHCHRGLREEQSLLGVSLSAMWHLWRFVWLGGRRAIVPGFCCGEGGAPERLSAWGELCLGWFRHPMETQAVAPRITANGMALSWARSLRELPGWSEAGHGPGSLRCPAGSLCASRARGRHCSSWRP